MIPEGNKIFKTTLTFAMIPEAVAFAFVAGVSPIVGLQTTAVLGFVAAAFGGRGGMTSGASGACAVVVAGLVREHGAGYLPGCVVLAGFAQAFLGLVGAGKFIRMVPHPVMLGFINGLAVVMLSAQLTHFRAPLALGLRSPEFLTMAGLTAATMALVTVVPRVTRRVPPSLAAAAVTLATRILHLPATTLVDLAGPAAFAGGVGVLPALSPTFAVLALAPWSLCTVRPLRATMAVVGIVESLLTMQLVDGLADDGTRGSTRQECVGQGLGNLASGLLGGQGGCALIGQSLINVQSGGTSRLSGMAMAAFLALGLLAARNGAWSALVLEADADSDPIYEVAVDYSKKGAAPPKPPKPTTRDRPTGAGFGEAGYDLAFFS
ncbi:secondary active sulfate transmembrane transporter [Aureococcus anophagefferens]|nr:secondary active sulfate transmembrane transporter [Aureococcus anophagefferens]